MHDWSFLIDDHMQLTIPFRSWLLFTDFPAMCIIAGCNISSCGWWSFQRENFEEFLTIQWWMQLGCCTILCLSNCDYYFPTMLEWSLDQNLDFCLANMMHLLVLDFAHANNIERRKSFKKTCQVVLFFVHLFKIRM